MLGETTACLCCGSADLRPYAVATDREYFTTIDTFAYLCCRRCQALSISPVPSDRLGEIYPETYYSGAARADSLIERLKLALDRRLLRAVLAPMEGKALNALDIGGGAGWMLDQARAVEPRLTSGVVVDLSEEARSPAEASGYTYVCGRIEDYVADRQFDLILIMNLIEHVQDPVATLAKAGACLKPTGRILLKTPNHDSLDARLFRTSYWGGLHCPRHWVLFTPESLRGAVERAGLCVADIKLTQGAPFWAWSFASLLARWGVIHLGPDRPAYRHPIIPVLTAAFAAFDFARRPFMRTSQMFAIIKPTTGPT